MIGVYDDRHVELTLFHPWEKPVSLIERLVRIYTDVEDVVCDPYMGSGTTAIACIRTGRQFWGIEIDPGYFDIARKRIQEELSGVCPTDALEPKGGLL
jgi:DNA modification methylase